MIELLSRELLNTLARSGRVEIIRTLKAFPENDFSISELAKVARVPTMTAWRSVKELKAAGLVRTRRVGNSISVRITEDRDRLKALRLVPDTDPQRAAARLFSERLGENAWMKEAKLFGSIGRGEHSPGEEVDVAVVYDSDLVQEGTAKEISGNLATILKAETNVSIVPFLISEKEMSRKGGIAGELREREVIWSR